MTQREFQSKIENMKITLKKGQDVKVQAGRYEDETVTVVSLSGIVYCTLMNGKMVQIPYADFVAR